LINNFQLGIWVETWANEKISIIEAIKARGTLKTSHPELRVFVISELNKSQYETRKVAEENQVVPSYD
jgi:hypothetical protein